MAISSSFFVDKIGRRKLFLVSNAGMLAGTVFRISLLFVSSELKAVYGRTVFIVWTVTSALFQETGSKAAADMTIVMIFLYYAFYDIAYTPLLVVYAVEILPFRLRAKGFAAMVHIAPSLFRTFNTKFTELFRPLAFFQSFTISLALIFNQYVNPVALAKLRWKYYIL